jgi:hypothetical protein
MVQAISMAIYVQVLGAFIWLFVVVLLERSRRSSQQRLQELEAELDRFRSGTSQAIEDAVTAMTALRETCKLRHENAALVERLRGKLGSSAPPEEHEQTDPAYRLPSDFDHARPKSPETDDEPLGSIADGHWQCNGCGRTCVLDKAHHGKKCVDCGGTVELITYDPRRQSVQLPLPIKASGAK